MPTTKRPSTPSPKPAPAAKPRKRAAGAGRPPGSGAFQPTAEQRQLVTVMAGMGIPEDQMVVAIMNPKTGQPITPVTLRKHLREELDKGFVQANAKVGLGLFKNATTPTETYPGGIPTAQLFWLKCRARWQQNPERNPPPPPAAHEDVDIVDAARRMAFALAVAAESVPPAAKPTKPTSRKRQAQAA